MNNNLDSILTQIDNIQQQITDIINGERDIKELKQVDAKLDALWIDTELIQDTLIEIEHQISKLSY